MLKTFSLSALLLLTGGGALIGVESPPLEVEVQLKLTPDWTLANTTTTESAQVREYIKKNETLAEHSEIISYIRLPQDSEINLEKVYNQTISKFQSMGCTIQQSGARADENLLSMYLLYDCPKMSIVGMNQFVDGRDGFVHTVGYEIRESPLTLDLQTKLQSLFLKNLEVCQGPCRSASLPAGQN